MNYCLSPESLMHGKKENKNQIEP